MGVPATVAATCCVVCLIALTCCPPAVSGAALWPWDLPKASTSDAAADVKPASTSTEKPKAVVISASDIATAAPSAALQAPKSRSGKGAGKGGTHRSGGAKKLAISTTPAAQAEPSETTPVATVTTTTTPTPTTKPAPSPPGSLDDLPTIVLYEPDPYNSYYNPLPQVAQYPALPYNNWYMAPQHFPTAAYNPYAWGPYYPPEPQYQRPYRSSTPFVVTPFGYPYGGYQSLPWWQPQQVSNQATEASITEKPNDCKVEVKEVENKREELSPSVVQANQPSAAEPSPTQFSLLPAAGAKSLQQDLNQKQEDKVLRNNYYQGYQDLYQGYQYDGSAAYSQPGSVVGQYYDASSTGVWPYGYYLGYQEPASSPNQYQQVVSGYPQYQQPSTNYVQYQQPASNYGQYQQPYGYPIQPLAAEPQPQTMVTNTQRIKPRRHIHRFRSL